MSLRSRLCPSLVLLGVSVFTKPAFVLSEDTQGGLRELGATYFQQYCASCHGADAKGQGTVGLLLKTPPPNLTKISARNSGEFPSEIVKNAIDGREMPQAHGRQEMPVWGRRFSEKVGGGSLGEELVRGYAAGLLEYLQSIQEPQ